MFNSSSKYIHSSVTDVGRLTVLGNNILYQPSRYTCDKIWPKCACYDTSMIFGTHLDFINTKIFGYRAISDFALERVDGHFFKMAAVSLFSHILTADSSKSVVFCT